MPRVFQGATAPGADVEYLTDGEGTTQALPATPVEFLQGVPARTLTDEEVEALEPAVRRELEASTLYSKDGGEQQGSKPAQAGAASSTVVTPQKLTPPTAETTATEKQGDA